MRRTAPTRPTRLAHRLGRTSARGNAWLGSKPQVYRLTTNFAKVSLSSRWLECSHRGPNITHAARTLQAGSKTNAGCTLAARGWARQYRLAVSKFNRNAS